ncbi:MAG TPA: hypothetical protein VKA46_08340 [Gemmataceae bacterium]|nr:hypothetical protein [Gemmataceae bacterium]
MAVPASTGPASVPPLGGKPHEKNPTIEIAPAEGGTSGEISISVGGVPPLEAKPAVPPKPATPGTVASLPKGPAPDPIHIGTTPSVSVPPLSIPAAPAPALIVRGAQPDVISYTEEPYGAKPGDTFKSISEAKYGTDKYASALYHFNHSHPLIEGDLPEETPLTPAQKIYLPPPEILKTRYPEQVPGSAPAPATGATIDPAPQRSSAPPAPRKYQVGSGGEFEYDIARKLLGNGERWMEIKDLNPGWRPEVPIPEGTQLTLPPDARVPQ